MASLTATQVTTFLKSLGYGLTDTLRRNASRLFKWRLTPIVLRKAKEQILLNQKYYLLSDETLKAWKEGTLDKKNIPTLIISIDGRYDSSRSAQWATVTAICTSRGVIVAQRTYRCGDGEELDSAYHAEKVAIKEILEELKAANIVVTKVVHDDCKTLTAFINDDEVRNLVGEPIENGLDIFHATKNFKRKVAKFFGKDASVNRVRFIEVNINSLKAAWQDAIGEDLLYRLMDEHDDFDFPTADARVGMPKKEIRGYMQRFLTRVDVPYILVPVSHTFTTQPFAESEAVDPAVITEPDGGDTADTHNADVDTMVDGAAQAHDSDQDNIGGGCTSRSDDDLALYVKPGPFDLAWCKSTIKKTPVYQHLQSVLEPSERASSSDTPVQTATTKTQQYIRVVGKKNRQTKGASFDTQSFIDISISNLKSDIVDSIGDAFLFKAMKDDDGFAFDGDVAVNMAKKRDLMKDFLSMKGDSMFVFIPLHAGSNPPSVSDIRTTTASRPNTKTTRRPNTRVADAGVDTIELEQIADDFVIPIENNDADEQSEYELFLSRGAISMSWLSGATETSCTGRQLSEVINTESAKHRSSVLVRIVGAKTRGSAGKTTSNQLCIDHLRHVYGGGDAWFENTKKRIGRHYFHCCSDPKNDTPEKLLSAMHNFANHLIGDHQNCSKRDGRQGCTTERQEEIQAAMAECRKDNASYDEDSLKLQIHLFVDTVLEMDSMMKRIPSKERAKYTASWSAYKERDRIPTDKCRYLINSAEHSSSANESYHRKVNKHCPKDLFFRSSMKAKIALSTLDWCELKDLHVEHNLSPADVRKRCMAAYDNGGRDAHEKELNQINLTKCRLRAKRYLENEYSLHIRTLVGSPNTMPHIDALQTLKEHKLIGESVSSLMDIPDANRFFRSIQHLECPDRVINKQ